MQTEKPLDNFGAMLVKDVVSKEIANFLTSILLLKKDLVPDSAVLDSQVPNALSVMDHDVVTYTVLEQVWPFLEAIVQEKLLPTYAYSRLYTNKNVLEKHIDRPACEVSVSVQLGRSHHYAWPIYMGDKRYELAEGDGVIYKGCNIEHWRNECDGPEGYYSGQLFLHYVRANGPYAEHAGDKKWDTLPFKKFRNTLMVTK
jgi:hypothetical protein